MKRIIFVAIVFVLAGCDRGKEDLNAWMAREVQGIKRGIAPLPEIKPFVMPSFDAGEERSPFDITRFLPETRNVGGKAPNPDHVKEPLEAYPIESLAFVGVLEQNGVRYALIKADKAIHQIKVGNYIGQNFGVVSRVNEYDLDVTELVQDPNGDWIERTSTLQLQEQEAKK